MFLNLKSKRVETALQQHLKTHIHPKTQREDRPERLSKEHAEIRTKKPAQNAMIKKQTASTALTTLQPGSSCSNVAHHYIIHRIESVEKEGAESFSKSIEKMDSQRSQKIANAYRKIKKYDGIEHRVHTEDSGEQRPRKSVNRTHYPMTKKQIVTNFANNYIAITEADELDSKRMEKNQEKDVVEYCSKIIEMFIQAFRKESKLKSSSLAKYRSLSSKEIDMHDSLQRSKRSNKNAKSRKGLTATQCSHQNDQQTDTLQDFADRIRQNLAKAQQQFDSSGSIAEEIFHFSTLMKELYAEVCWFVKQMQSKCLGQLQQKCSQYQKGLQIVVLEQTQLQTHCRKLQEAIAIQRNRNSILAQSLEELHNRSLYSCAFLNQLSFDFDLDTFIHQKICEFTGETSSLNLRNESSNSLALKQEFLQSDFGFYKQGQE